VPLVDNFKDGGKEIIAMMNKVKASPQPFGYFYVVMVSMMLPRIISSFLLERYSD
jgi:hypothetical protein